MAVGFCSSFILHSPITISGAPFTYDGRAFWKVESITAQMPRDMFEMRLRQSNPQRFSWELMSASGLTVADLDENLILLTLQDAVSNRRVPATALSHKSIEEVLGGFELLGVDGKLLNASEVLFGKNPHHDFMQCSLRMARFEGTDKRVFRDQTVCEGNLFEQYDEAINFCRKHFFLGGTMDSKVRVDIPTVPFSVLKESIINMLCHRSWEAYNLTPNIAIYDDRMELQNPGTFPSGYQWEDFLKSLGSMPRNPLIASIFYKRGIMESWGRGISLIMEECEKAGMPKPTFHVDRTFVTLTIFFKEPIVPFIRKNGVNNGTKGGTKGGTKEMPERENVILEAIRVNPNIKTTELTELVNISARTLRRITDKLKEQGIIARTGGRKDGQWVVLN